MRRAALCSLIVLLAVVSLLAQETGVGRKIYSEASGSVLLLYVQSTDGNFVAQGSGFVIEGQRIVTNAHVANTGKVFVELGPARIPARVEKLDAAEDLAILVVDVQLIAKPLRLSNKKPSPGDVVYAISNPEGLEKTISQGVVSSLREIDGRRMLQLTAAISHGSSGGPILDSSGEVVGVAAGSLISGQSLNFAVPASDVIRLLTTTSNSDSGDVSKILRDIQMLDEQQKHEDYSAETTSPWHVTQEQIKALLERAFGAAGTNVEALLQVAAASESEDIDIAIKAAQRAAEISKAPKAQLVLAKDLNFKAIWERGDEQTQLYKRAERAARIALAGTRTPLAENYYTLADILENENSYLDAETNFKLSLEASEKSSDAELKANSLRGLARCSASLKKPIESQNWFDKLVATGNANSWDWSLQAQRLSLLGKVKESGDAYFQAGEMGTDYKNWCEAATMYTIADEKDLALSSARTCIGKAMGKSGAEKDLAAAHQEIASILNERGVYSEALSHAKEATELDATDPWAFYQMGGALRNLHRPQEATVALQQAIRLSDGKYSDMHFLLGNAYFDTENWESAKQSFQKASELDRKDPLSAYNVALCFQRMRINVDAAYWYEEYLRRKPDADDRDRVRDLIRLLRGVH
jgi:tetratricopeptide (TPR) repeat protein